MSDNLKKDILSVASTNNTIAEKQATNKNSNFVNQILKPPKNLCFTLKDPQTLFEDYNEDTNN